MAYFKAIGSNNPNTGLRVTGQAALTRQAFAHWAGRVTNRIADYPAQRATTYVRTGTLGRNWRMKVETTEATVYNPTEYAKWVQGQQQTSVMAGKGWKTIEKIAQDELPKLNDELKHALLLK